MRRRRAGKRRDANEPEIVAALRKAGAKVILMEDPAPFDAWVLFREDDYAMEVKNPDAHNTIQDSQEKALEMGFPIYFVHSVEEALRMIGVGE